MKKEAFADIVVLVACILFIVNTILINVHIGIYAAVICLVGFSYLLHKNNGEDNNR